MSTNRLDALRKFYWKHKRLPSYSEMLKIFGFASKKAIHLIVHKWIEEGILKIDSHKVAPTSRFFALPLFGTIKAGFPIIAEENRDYLSLDEYLIEDPTSSFLLKVSGDSLTGVGIYDGDIVIIEKKRSANPGDIVLAEIDREWTLKILQKQPETSRFFLVAANPKYPPFFPSQEMKIFGVVGAVIRKLRN